MFINFSTQEIEARFGFRIENEFPSLYNQWSPFEGSSGADVRLQVVHLGKRIEGNSKKLRIAVYETANPYETLILLPLNQVEMALEVMGAMAGKGDLVCCE